MSRCVAHYPQRGSRGFSAGVVVTLLLFVLAATCVSWVYAGMMAAERWPIRWLKVNGPFERVSAEQVRASLAPLLADSFFIVDTGRMRDVAGDMPWVAGVTVQKSWPDEISVTIHEHTPLAHWVDGYLIASNGQQFMVPAADEIQGLPWLEGPQSQLGLVLGNWTKLDDQLVIIGQRVERFTLDPRGSWSVRLSSGTEIRFGKGDFLAKLDVLISTWSGLMQGQTTPPVSIDLRYTNGFAVLWPKNMEASAGNYGKSS